MSGIETALKGNVLELVKPFRASVAHCTDQKGWMFVAHSYPGMYSEGVFAQFDATLPIVDKDGVVIGEYNPVVMIVVPSIYTSMYVSARVVRAIVGVCKSFTTDKDIQIGTPICQLQNGKLNVISLITRRQKGLRDGKDIWHYAIASFGAGAEAHVSASVRLSYKWPIILQGKNTLQYGVTVFDSSNKNAKNDVIALALGRYMSETSQFPFLVQYEFKGRKAVKFGTAAYDGAKGALQRSQCHLTRFYIEGVDILTPEA